MRVNIEMNKHINRYEYDTIRLTKLVGFGWVVWTWKQGEAMKKKKQV